MKRFLYIGQFSDGTTSKMRGKALKKLVKPINFEVIDTTVPFSNTSRLWRSIGFRYKMGPLIKAINSYIEENIQADYYDVIWVDKAVFITPKLTELLKSRTPKLIHFTPDMAFLENRSKFFTRAITIYDFVITTKTAEEEIYKTYVPKDKLLLMSQGYSKEIHRPYNLFEDKDNSIVFIGLAEQSRFDIAEVVISNNLTLKLVGHGWDKFVKKHKENKNLIYLGKTIHGEAYSKLISSSKFGLGLLSKRFQELHTTRTFEIPACGTALVTERNSELEQFFDDDEVVFFKNHIDMVNKIKFFLKNPDECENLTKKGREKVLHKKFDYESQLFRITKEAGINS